MAARTHKGTLGRWFFQAIVSSDTLSRMTDDACTAHQNKARGRVQRNTTKLPTDWINPPVQTTLHDYDGGHRVLLTGVRILRPEDAGEVSASPNGADMRVLSWWGDPAILFPRGVGVSPFVLRPVVTVSACEFILERDVQAITAAADWQSFNLTDQMTDMRTDYTWLRAYPGRPFGVDHRGRPGPSGWETGLRLFVIAGRLGATAPDGPNTSPGMGGPGLNANFKGIFIHWMASGYVRPY